MDIRPHIEKLINRVAQLEVELARPEVASNPTRMQELAQEYASLNELAALGREYLRLLEEISVNRALAEDRSTDPELARLARDEVEVLTSKADQLKHRLQLGIIPPDPSDSRDTIVEIRAAAGGEEAALFAADLYRMYTRYAISQGWKVEHIDSSPSDLGGFKEVVFEVCGRDVFRRLKYESGVHRVQRVPVTEAQGRIHTSTCTVAVLPEAQEVDVQINPDDLEISVCRASGPGGQGVNTTDSAVQILHKPTGLMVRCADERSQQKNKAKALKVLRTRLLEMKRAEENAKYAAQRRAQIGTGERNERIRTYNFPQNRVTDHRINLTIYNLQQVLDGDLGLLIEPLMAAELEKKIAELNK